jgi:hypothetical protein
MDHPCPRGITQGPQRPGPVEVGSDLVRASESNFRQPVPRDHPAREVDGPRDPSTTGLRRLPVERPGVARACLGCGKHRNEGHEVDHDECTAGQDMPGEWRTGPRVPAHPTRVQIRSREPWKRSPFGRPDRATPGMTASGSRRERSRDAVLNAEMRTATTHECDRASHCGTQPNPGRADGQFVGRISILSVTSGRCSPNCPFSGRQASRSAGRPGRGRPHSMSTALNSACGCNSTRTQDASKRPGFSRVAQLSARTRCIMG